MACRIATFPKCYLQMLVAERSMTLFDWIEMAATLPHVEGLEFYPPALESFEKGYLRKLRLAAEGRGLEIPMMCASPDFTRPDAAGRAEEVELYLRTIDATAELGGRYCRVLSGQRRPGVGVGEGVGWVVESIRKALPRAERRGVTLVFENHYKDGFWEHPEFAQRGEVYLEIAGRVEHPNFALNYDPSNALISGEDPYGLLEEVKHRVATMHASDRFLEGGTLEELKEMDADPRTGYADFVQHGVIGRGLIDYDRVFSTLASAGFSGWVSVEDGQDPEVGLEHLAESARFLQAKLSEHGLARRAVGSDREHTGG